jgi:two-component system, chemotaxis family, protein-glutamate methylesterase/glutaminase
MDPTRVLIVDDSAIVRRMLADSMRGERDLEVVGTAADPFIARDLILQHEPHVVTLDLEMPRMDGLTFLRKLMAHHPLPVIIVSSLTKSGSAASMEALRAGAIDVIPKPGGPYSVGQLAERLKQRIRDVRTGEFRFGAGECASLFVARAKPVSSRRLNGLLVIGASTGGTQATEALLTRMPADCPPVLIVQHMPANFTRAYAERLDAVCPMRVAEAGDGDVPRRGVALVAPGDCHLVLEATGVRMRVAVRSGPPVHHQRPSVDVLFNSVARVRGVPVVACLLTGMGADGADGMVALKQAGAETIAQDERSCVVFGMPREAIGRGGATHVVTLLRMPGAIVSCFERLNAGSAPALAG